MLCGQVSLQPANHVGGNEALQQPADRARQANIHLREAQLGIAIGAQLDQIDIVDAYDFSATGVDDLLVEQIFLDREQRFVGFVKIQRALADIETNVANSHRGDLVVTGHQRREMAAGQQEMGDAIGLVGGLDEKFANAADVIALRVVGFGAHQFSGVKFHGVFLLLLPAVIRRCSLRFAEKQKTREPIRGPRARSCRKWTCR